MKLLLKDSLRPWKIKFINIYVYIDKLDDIVNKYNNKYHKTIKMKPVDVKSNTYIDLIKKLIVKILNLKLASLHSKLIWRSFCD